MIIFNTMNKYDLILNIMVVITLIRAVSKCKIATNIPGE